MGSAVVAAAVAVGIGEPPFSEIWFVLVLKNICRDGEKMTSIFMSIVHSTHPAAGLEAEPSAD